MREQIKKKSEDLSGFLIVDKPAGYTSHDIVEEIRKYIPNRKVGHLGTLDPLATGVLPIAIGKATKLTSILLSLDKKYIAKIRFGMETDNGDITGDVVHLSGKEVSQAEFTEILPEFTGEIRQTPPEYSAIRVNGVRAFNLARRGIRPKMKSRKVKIYKLELQEFNEKEATIFIHCSKGTYIRALVRDMGRKLQCGATLESLRRVETGPFNIEDALKFGELVDYLNKGKVDEIMMGIIPEKIGYKSIYVKKQMSYRIRNGIAPQLSQARALEKPEVGEVVFILEEGGNALAVARYVPSKQGDFEFIRVLK